MTHFTRKKPLAIIAAVLAVLMLANALAMTIGAASGSTDLRATLDRLVYSIRSLNANKPAVLAEPEEPVYGDPYYTVNTSEPLTIDEKGHIITLNDEDGNYIASTNGSLINFKNAIITGDTWTLMLGQYRTASYNKFNTVVDNVSTIGLNVTNGIKNGTDKISIGVAGYGNLTLNNCTMVGTTTTADGYIVHDAGFTNGSKVTINGGQYGSLYVWSQSHVTIYDAEIENITSAAITTRNLGLLTIGAGTHVGTIDLTVGGYKQYKPALVIEEGATVDRILYKGVTYTQEQWENPFAGRYISIMGDSISTYTGWSDANPITDPSCTNRYGEAYYGPVGGDFHNTELLVEDTWWHQAATELGSEILMSNAGNSTGLFIAEYPANAAWDLYLKEMLAYKSRPYYLGTEEHDPDIIALYIGSNELARYKNAAQLGSVAAIDFDQLIVDNGDGTYTYANPTTIAEAYCILIHKVQVTYPNAEIYCFAPVPSAGGYLSTVNTRFAKTVPFNKMVKEVAKYNGCHVVDLVDAFDLDPDGDGKVVQEDFERFQSYFHNDPHPNAEGFDVITDAFVDAVRKNSKFNK